MKKLAVVYILLALVLIVTGCDKDNNKSDANMVADDSVVPLEQSLIKLDGVITDVTAHGISLLTESDEPYVVHFPDELSTDGLIIGEMISIGFTGEVMESYPMQINALAILQMPDQTDSEFVEFYGRVTKVNLNNIEMEDSKGEPYVVHLNNVYYEEGVSETFEIGNLVIIGFSGAVMESYPMQIDAIVVLANEADQIISLDPREEISGIIGEFPKVVITDIMTTHHLNRDDVFAIALDVVRDIDYHWEVVIDGTWFEMIGDGQKESVGSGIHYFGFRAIVTGDYQLSFKLVGPDQSIEETRIYNINISE